MVMRTAAGETVVVVARTGRGTDQETVLGKILSGFVFSGQRAFRAHPTGVPARVKKRDGNWSGDSPVAPPRSLLSCSVGGCRTFLFPLLTTLLPAARTSRLYDTLLLLTIIAFVFPVDDKTNCSTPIFTSKILGGSKIVLVKSTSNVGFTSKNVASASIRDSRGTSFTCKKLRVLLVTPFLLVKFALFRYQSQPFCTSCDTSKKQVSRRIFFVLSKGPRVFARIIGSGSVQELGLGSGLVENRVGLQVRVVLALLRASGAREDFGIGGNVVDLSRLKMFQF